MYELTLSSHPDHVFTLCDSPETRAFIEAFRDTQRDLTGQRFTVHYRAHLGNAEFGPSPLTFTITSHSGITLAGDDFTRPKTSSSSDSFWRDFPTNDPQN